MAKPTIYLAGPISGCNRDQLHVWRNELKRTYAEEFSFIDPTDHLLDHQSSHFEVVQADVQAIRTADAVLANMWKESVGTAMGMVHAHIEGKPVVVCDPNYIGSRTVAFYSDAAANTIEEAIDLLRTLLRVSASGYRVLKSDGSEEPFDRQKLAQSVRRACVKAKQGDVVPARSIVQLALDSVVTRSESLIVIPTALVSDCIWDAISSLGSRPRDETDYTAIRHEWESFAEDKTMSLTQQKSLSENLHVPTVHEKALDVRIVHPKGHSTIWGNKIDADAERIFQDILRVEGIQELRFGPFTNTSSPPIRPHVRLQASKQGIFIEGHCYAKGRKGTKQSFQIKVVHEKYRDSILSVLNQLLASRGHIKERIIMSS